jgi:hypothetical protein
MAKANLLLHEKLIAWRWTLVIEIFRASCRNSNHYNLNFDRRNLIFALVELENVC